MIKSKPPLLPLLLAVALAVASILPAGAQEFPAWQPTGLARPTWRLFTPASGAFFAHTADGLLRSDDGGGAWSAVNVPAGFKRGVVDPTNHAVIYAAAEGGLYKTADDAASWQLIMPTTWTVTALAVSPADPNLVYLALKDQPVNAIRFQRHRSRDGGATWEQLENSQASLCGFGVLLLEPHPTDPQRVFSAHTCFAGRTTTVELDHSADQWTTLTTLLRPNTHYAGELVGGRGAQPGRYYLAAERDHRFGGSTLYRSDDDGATWSEALSFPNALEGGGAREVGPDVGIAALAYDPANPDRVWLSLAETSGRGQAATKSYRLTATADGGATWTDLNADLGPVHDLALGIDGANLYAAGEHGVWRLPLT